MEKAIINKETVTALLKSLPKGEGLRSGDFLVMDVDCRVEEINGQAWEKVLKSVVKESIGIQILVPKIYQEGERSYFHVNINQLPKYSYQVKLKGYDTKELKIIFWSEAQFGAEDLIEQLAQIVDWSLAV